jgi:hypothetical protein
MRASLVGGTLIVGAALLLALTLIVALGGGSVSVRGVGPGSLTLTAALLLLGAGSAVLAVDGSAPLDGRTVRVGFALIAFGVSASVATASVSTSSSLIYLFLLGSFATWGGTMVAAIGLLRAPGRPRWVGLTFVAGVLVALVAAGIANDPGVAFGPEALPRQVVAVVATVAAALMLVGVAGVGLLAIRGGEEAGRVAQ